VSDDLISSSQKGTSSESLCDCGMGTLEFTFNYEFFSYLQ
jgi:hypothetical protein